MSARLAPGSPEALAQRAVAAQDAGDWRTCERLLLLAAAACCGPGRRERYLAAAEVAATMAEKGGKR